MFIESIGKVFGINYSILVTYDNKYYDCKKGKYIEYKIKKQNYDLTISILNFEESNNKLLYDLCNNDKYLPENLKYLQDNTNILSKKLIKNKNDYKHFLTNKESIHSPELILFFGKDELCLYGFPFTLLENTEIM
jgi:hypothetical protein